MKKKIITLLICALSLSILTSSCKKTEEIEYQDSWQTINEFIYYLMHDYYLHYNKVPEYKTMTQFESPSEALDALMYKTLDSWSFVVNLKVLNDFYYSNAAVAYGFNLAEDEHKNIVVNYVEKNSSAQNAGITRGYIINSINGYSVKEIKDFSVISPTKSGESMTLGVTSPKGYTSQVTLSANEVATQTVPLYKTFTDKDNNKLGYILINSFVEDTPQKIDEAFNYFSQQNVKGLIVDLRYNGGGLVSGAEYLANAVIPSSYNNSVMYRYQYNDKHSDLNAYTYFNKSNVLSFNKIFVITTGQTASASELFINVLKPYINVIQIGEVSHGKPVGMNIFEYGDYAIAPITFATINSKGYGYYYSGMTPDIEMNEDYTTEIGSDDDPYIKAALNYVSTKSLKSDDSYIKTSVIEKKGFRSIINLY